MALTNTQLLLCFGMLITGSINTLSKKAQNDCSAPGYPFNNATAASHEFKHPWFQTIIMFIGEMLCLIGLCYARWQERKEYFQIQSARLMVSPVLENIQVPHHTRVFQWLFLIPTIFDLIGTSVAGIGLLYVDASVWQMLRGSIIVFTGLLSKIFLRRKLRPLQWTGIVFTVVGLGLVGLSGILRENQVDQGHKPLLGIVLILGSQLISAAQMIVEEIFLKGKKFPPLQLVGMEGTFGFLLMAIVILPAMYYIPSSDVGGRYEDSLDALYQLGNNPWLIVFSLTYLLSIAFYNYFGLAVTKTLTAVHRTLIDACRTILVWLGSLFIYYVLNQDFGEAFDHKYGIFQIDGFMYLMVGTAIYNELIYFPFIRCLDRTQEETYPSLVGSDAINDSSTEQTPLLQEYT